MIVLFVKAFHYYTKTYFFRAENDQRRTVLKIIIFMLIVCVIVAVTILFVIRSPTNHSSTEDLRLLTVNSESQSMGDTIHDGRFKVRRSKVFGTTWTPAIDKYSEIQFFCEI